MVLFFQSHTQSKERKLYKLRKLIMPLVIVTTVALAGCANTKPTASEWSAKFIEICTKVHTDREAVIASLVSPGEMPTLEKYMTFSAEFATLLEDATIRLKALERPNGLDTEIDEAFAALDIVTKYVRTEASDQASAELGMMRVIDQSLPMSPEALRLDTAMTALGMEECN